MSDLGQVVQKLSETNQRLETLEKQGKENDSAASIIASSLPEILSDRKLASEREQFDKDQNITGTDDNVKDNTKIIGAKIDATNMILKGDDKVDKDFIGPMPKPEPELKPTNTASDEEDENDRTKALKSVFAPLKKSFDKVGNSITGFIGGMAKTVTGGAELFLKGIISATVLGLIIKFLQSDYFKDFLSEENLNKLADFFKNIGTYFQNLFDFLADSTNPNSIAFAIAAGVGLFLAGGLISKIIGGVTSTFKFLRTLGTLFGIGGALGSKNMTTMTNATTAANKTSAKNLGKNSKFLKFLKAGAFVGLAIGAFEGITAAQDAYNKGESGQKVFGSFVGGVLESLSFGIINSDTIKEFISPDKQKKILEKESNIKKLEEKQEAGEDFIIRKDKLTNKDIAIPIKELLEKEKKALAELRVAAQIEKDDQNQFLKEKKENEDFAKKRAIFLRKTREDLGVKFSSTGQIIGGRPYKIRQKEEELLAEFDKKFSPKLKREAIEEKKKAEKKALKLENDNFEKAKMKELNELKIPALQTGTRLARQTLIGLGDFGGAGMTINNNIVNSNQSDNSSVQNKINQSKSVTPSLQEQYLVSST